MTQFEEDRLDDPDALSGQAAELLKLAAGAGAQVRSTAAAAEEAGLDRLAGARPRAIVLISRPGAPGAAAPLVVALLGPACSVPVLISPSVPSWVGALDVVVAHACRVDDLDLAEGVDRAVRRGAQVLITAAEEGPVAAAAAGRAIVLQPRLEVPHALALPRALTAGLLLAQALGLLRIDPEALADELDREAARLHPDLESFVNPAKSIALRMAGRTPLLWGLDPVATAVAGHSAVALAAHAGVVAQAAGYPEVMELPALFAEASRTGDTDDLFRDPYLDDGPGAVAVRPILLGVLNDVRWAAVRHAASSSLPGTDLISVEEELVLHREDPMFPSCAAAVLALRLQTAAMYLGLGRGVFGGSGRSGAPVV